jgi:hypothetical protein
MHMLRWGWGRGLRQRKQQTRETERVVEGMLSLMVHFRSRHCVEQEI